MTIYSFSTSHHLHENDAIVRDFKDLCNREGYNFSKLVVRSLDYYRKHVLENGHSHEQNGNNNDHF